MKTWQCQRDGACCRNNDVVMTPAEWAVLGGHRPLRLVHLDRTREAEGFIVMQARPCPFFRLSTGECTVYEDRPYNCRRFQCGRHDVTREPYTENPMPLIVRDNDLRWSYAANQRAHQDWARAHGWPDEPPTT